MPLSESPSEGFQNARFIGIVFFYYSASDQMTHFGGKEMQQHVYDLGILLDHVQT